MPTWTLLLACGPGPTGAPALDAVAPRAPAEPPAIGAASDTGAFRPGEDTAPLPAPVVSNPVAYSAREPFIRHADGWYYLLVTLMDRIELRRSASLAGLGAGERRVIWTPPAGTPHSVGLQGPELHRVEDTWYVYYAATDSAIFDLSFNYRLFALASDGPDLWTATFSFADELVVPGTDAFSLQPTRLERDGQAWMIWSGNRFFLDFTQHLFIAEMVTPTRLGRARALLHTPTAPWETRDGAIAESPQVVLHDDAVVLTWSASNCDSDRYATGVMTLPAGEDPMDVDAWVKPPSPVFVTQADAGIYNPGHVAFFTSPDGTQDWMSWDAGSAPAQGCGSLRTTQVQPLSWGPDGLPVFTTPPSVGTAFDAPSGEAP